MRPLARALVNAGIRCAGIFYRLEYKGAMPRGPVLLVANHPNMLLDPLLTLGAARRRVRTVVKAPHFRTPVFAAILRGVGALPVYRLRDDPRLLARNRQTFQQAAGILGRGGSILIFPEGGSAADPALRPLKAGAARVALSAAAQSGWALGLHLVPVGVTYRQRALFRSRALACLGEPIQVGAWREEHDSDPTRAIRSLTDAMTGGLEAVTLNLGRHSDWHLIETIDLLRARETGVRRPERQPLSERLPRLQRIARRLYALRERDPARHEVLVACLDRHLGRQRRLLGRGSEAAPIDVSGIAPGGLWRRVGLVAAGLPLAALGTLAWYVPYALTGLIAGVARPAWEKVATVKLLTGMILFPIAYAAEVGLAAVAWGGAVALAAALILPGLFFFTLRWHDVRREVCEDLNAWVRGKRRPRAFARLARRGQAIAHELESTLADRVGFEQPAAREAP